MKILKRPRWNSSLGFPLTDSHDHHHDHNHGHPLDQGLTGLVRYLRFLPSMLSNATSDYVLKRLEVQPGERVVDIGAGLGPAAVAAAKLGAHVTAVDPTPYMRAGLKIRRAVSSGRKLIRVADGSAEFLPLTSGTADVAWASNSAHHWSSLDAGAAEIFRVLAPGGRVLLVEGDFDDPNHCANDSGRWAKAREKHKHQMAPKETNELVEALTNAGFVDIEGGRVDVAERQPAWEASGVKPRSP